jgi:hypothetical protein
MLNGLFNEFITEFYKYWPYNDIIIIIMSNSNAYAFMNKSNNFQCLTQT